MIENTLIHADTIKQSEQQKAQHTLTAYISKATALLTQFLVEQDPKQEKAFGEIAQILFKIKQDLTAEVDKHKSVDGLCVRIGFKETSRINIPVTAVVNTLKTDVAPQRFVFGKKVVLVAPAILDGLFILQAQMLNASPTHKLQIYSLIGKNNLPKEYQQLPINFEP